MAHAKGYKTTGKVDPSWWMEEIKAGEDFRKVHAREDRWDNWRRYYRGRWNPGVLPVNIFFSMLRMTVPRIYFRNPAVSVSPAMPGFLNMAFAQVVNRIDNKMLEQMHVKREIKRMVRNTFLFGTSFAKTGFGGMYTPSPVPDLVFDDLGRKRGSMDKVEYHPDVFPSMPWFMNTHPGSVVVPAGADTYENCRWVAVAVQRPIWDIRNDERFDASARRDIKPTKRPESDRRDSTSSVEYGELYEIRDRQTGKVIVLPAHCGSETVPLYFGTDELQEDGNFPVTPLIFNDDDEVFWGVPDAAILEPPQLELNEIRTQMMKHRRLAIVKILARNQSISEEEISKMISEDVAAVINVEGDPNTVISKFQVADIPQSLILSEREVMQDVREMVGFSRNWLGEFQPGSEKPTAHEVEQVRQAADIRIDERKDMVADVLLAAVKSMNHNIFKRWDSTNVVDLVGPGGAQVWVQFNPRTLGMGKYTIKVDPDSSTPRTREVREGRAFRIYEWLKMNPLVDPIKLTQFALSELEGVQFDDLMANLPPNESGEGSTPGRAVSLGGFAQMLAAKAGERR